MNLLLKNDVPGREEIMTAKKEVCESAPGEDGVKIVCIRNACEEVKADVVEIVQKMFEYRVDRWEENVKVGIMISLY